MAVEGGLSGWRMGMDLLQEHIRMVAVKDFAWFKDQNIKSGEKKWRVHLVPLSEGLVPWAEVFKYLHNIGFNGPVSIHSEYEHLNLEELIRQTKEDLKYLKGILMNL
jgi:sugar phosphate isomerase/epimerase